MPKEPSRVRVSIWRRLKKSGAANIGQSIWVLPINDEHLKIYKEIEAEVNENSGHAFIMRTMFIQEQNEKSIVNYFNSARNEEYKELLEKCEDFKKEIEKERKKENFNFAEIDENERELDKLNVWFDAIVKRDFFVSSLREQSINALSGCKDLLEAYCNEVYERNGAL
jgi:hypothetical protein